MERIGTTSNALGGMGAPVSLTDDWSHHARQRRIFKILATSPANDSLDWSGCGFGDGRGFIDVGASQLGVTEVDRWQLQQDDEGCE